MSQKLFITATGTDIGKSFITAALARQARRRGHSVMAYKPVISGFDPDHVDNSDIGVLLRSLDMPLTIENIERISPFRFKAPLAPSMAARQEQRVLDFEQIIEHGQIALSGTEDLILIEGVGGVMVPLTGQHTVLDWIEALTIPVLLIAGSYVGTISHTLTALAVLQERNIPVQAIVVNESEGAGDLLVQTGNELERWTHNIPVKTCRRMSEDGNENPDVRHVFDSIMSEKCE